MKRYAILFLSIISVLYSSFCVARTIVPGERLWDMQRLVTESSCDATIHQSDFSGGALTINSAGVYCMAEDAVGKIIIAANHVVLNLNGKQLSNTSDDAIVVNGVSDVDIRNGFIGPSSGYGIYIASGNSEVVISMVEIKECSEAIRCDSSSQVTIDHCDLMLSTTGMTLYDSHDVNIRQTKAMRNAYAGFSLLGCNGTQFLECSALYTGYGSTDPLINVYGFISDGGMANVFESCIAQRTLALTVTGVNNVAAGFAFTGTENSSKIIDCESDVVQTYEDGYAMPYGILLKAQFDELVTVTGASQGSLYGWSVSWSPDGAYLATAGDPEGGDHVQLFSFDRVNGTLTKIKGLALGGTQVYAVSWSPDGAYLAVGVDGSSDSIQIFLFDRVSGSLTQTDVKSQANQCAGLSWSYDGAYLATTGAPEGGKEVQVFSFDRTTGYLTKVDGAVHANWGWRVAWSPDGTYLATVGDDAGDGLQIFLFDRATETLSKTDGVISSDECYGVSWSPDGRYLAVGVDGSPAIQVFSFNSQTGTLTYVTGSTYLTFDGEVAWSSDGQYLAAIGTDTYDIVVFSFDRALGQLSSLAYASQGGDGWSIAWSPDGAYIATAGKTEGTYNEVQIFSALTFPSNNVIKNNIVHGASGNSSVGMGVGISGSSIENLIVGNTSYDNALSNYYFVQNVFNPLFFEAPSLLQNMGIVSQVPLYTIHSTIPALAPDGIRYLRQKNVYNNGMTILLSGRYTFAEDIIADLTISAGCVTLDLGGHCLIGSITISSDDVTILNGTIKPTAAAGLDGITVTSTSERTEIHDVTIRCEDLTSTGTGLHGIVVNGADWEIYNCTVIAGAGYGEGNPGGDAIITGTFAQNIAIHDCFLYGADGGDSLSSNPAGDGGRGIYVHDGARDIEITHCTIFKTGNGGTNSGGGAGGNGGHGIHIESSCIDVSVHHCVIRNTGAGGSGAPGGKAILDEVSAAGAISVIFNNVAHNIANATKFDLKASGGEDGWQILLPPNSVAINKYANVYML